MKIDLNTIDRESFMVHQHLLNGEVCWLVQPQHIGCKWNQQNKIFRSSVWNNDGELISAGFKKFVNFGENPDNFPPPKSLDNTAIVEKIDGSLLIVSKYKGQYILRTRGTVDATKLDNGAELEIFKQKYPVVFDLYSDDPTFDTWPFSLLFEWVSPLQKIILNYGDQPEWYLVGGVNHKEYTLWGQTFLNNTATKIGCPRPPIYQYKFLIDLIEDVDKWKGKEGICLYYDNDQSILKIKSMEYLAKHRFKSQATLENTVDLFFSFNCPSYKEFETKLIEVFDYECFEMVRGFISQICDAYKEVNNIVKGMCEFVNITLKPLPTRRDQAQKVLSSYGNTNRSQFVFSILDGKALSSEQYKKLLWQCLKR